LEEELNPSNLLTPGEDVPEPNSHQPRPNQEAPAAMAKVSYKAKLARLRHEADKLAKTKKRRLAVQPYLLRAQFQKEATIIFARFTCMGDIIPTMAINCRLYGLFLHRVLHGTNRFGWAAQTPNLFICDGILQGVSGREIHNELRQEINFDCDASILKYMYRTLFMKIKKLLL
jgi:hypothetical protein